MNCGFNWVNLPNKIKEKLNIDLKKNWFNLPNVLNKKLDELKLTKPNCYTQLYPKSHRIIWNNLPKQVEKICQLIDCQESTTNFDVEADWLSVGVIDSQTFKVYLDSLSGEDVVIEYFSLVSNRLIAIISNVSFVQLNSVNINNFNYITIEGLQGLYLSFNQLTTFNPTLPLPTSLQGLDLSSNQLTTFNPTLPLPTSLQNLDLGNNQLTTSSYTNAETWANAQPIFTNSCNIYTASNSQSGNGTNLDLILNTKNANIVN